MPAPPSSRGPVLVLVPTEREAAPIEHRLAIGADGGASALTRVELRVTGVGKVPTALAADAACRELAPSAVFLVGCAGAFEAASPPLDVGDVALATEDVLADEGVETDDGFLTLRDLDFPTGSRGGETIFATVPLVGPSAAEASRLQDAARGGFRVIAGRLVTVSSGSGTDARARQVFERCAPIAESLEGAAAALVAWRRGIPCREIRGISNRVGARDRDAWDIDLACEHAGLGARAWIDALRDGETETPT